MAEGQDPNSGRFVAGNKLSGNFYTDKEKERIMGIFFDCIRKNYTVEQACAYAGVNKNTVYKWFDEDEDLQREYDLAKQGLLTKCNDVINNALNEGNADIAMRVLSKLDDRYKTKESPTNNLILDIGNILSQIQGSNTNYLDRGKVIDYNDIINDE